VGHVDVQHVSFYLPDGRPLLDDVSFRVGEGAKAALVGANGSGKTTLISALTGAREFDGGKLRTGHNVKLGLLAQHADDLQGATGTVLEACQRATKLTPNNARALLGQFLFSGEEAEKPLDGLSGGERQRLSLAILVHSGANVLILDEPTNHLDLESREALEEALQHFQGALLLVSHDRALLDAVGSRTVALEDQTLHSYVGGWPEYLRVREERADAERMAKRSKPVAAKVAAGPKPVARSKNEVARAKKLESQIEAAEAALAALEVELADPSAWNDPRAAAKSTARHAEAKKRLEDLYATWESVAS
jgi:ATP-binding cassette subfamily F protein 3